MLSDSAEDRGLVFGVYDLGFRGLGFTVYGSGLGWRIRYL